MRKRITPKFVENIKAKPNERLEIRDTICPGLTLRVSARSRKWILRAWLDGKVQTRTLGTTAEMGVAAARRKADEVREGAEAKPAKTAKEDGATVRRMMDDYLEHLETKGRAANHIRQCRSNLRDGRYSLLAFLDKKYGDGMAAAGVTPRMAADWLAATWRRAPGSIHHYRANAHAAFKWAMSAEFDYRRKGRTRSYGVTANPVAASPPAGPVGRRRMTFTPEALRTLWYDLPSHADAPMVYLVRLVIAMGGNRIRQFTELRKEWIRDGWIYWPAEAMKSRKDHALPLTPRAAQIVEATLDLAPEGSPYLFPGERDRRRPLTDTAVSRAVKRTLEGMEPRPILRDWRRTVKSEMQERGLAEKRELDIWHHHADHDVSEQVYTVAEFRAQKEATARKIDAFVGEWLEGKERKAA